MAFKKHRVITLKRLDSACRDVQAELDNFGLWNAELAAVDVYLRWFAKPYGWQLYRGTGDIEIPAVSLNRLAFEKDDKIRAAIERKYLSTERELQDAELEKVRLASLPNNGSTNPEQNVMLRSSCQTGSL